VSGEAWLEGAGAEAGLDGAEGDATGPAAGAVWASAGAGAIKMPNTAATTDSVRRSQQGMAGA
jgi:hypothetical protein